MRAPALVTAGSILLALFGGELLDPIGVPGIWFPFNIGVSRTQYVYAIAIPLVAFLIARTSTSSERIHGWIGPEHSYGKCTKAEP